MANSHPKTGNHPEAATTAGGDGRNVDLRLGTLSGEGAGIEVRDREAAWPLAPGITPDIHAPALENADDARDATYYDLPVVKMPPWKWYIPTYFAIGGLAGAASTLSGALELTGTRRDRLAHSLHWLALAGEAAGGALLIADLGRPARFHHMLRVFRPTSPMNLGTWILTAAGGTSALSVLAGLRGRPTPAVVSVGGIVSGAALSTYTGVLIGNTAVPLWHATRRQLPVWFAALSAASLGATLELIAPAHPLTRIYSVAGKASELVAHAGVEHAAAAAGVDAPLRSGRAGRMWRAARWLGAASLAASALQLVRPKRGQAVAAGVLGLAAGVLARFAITEAGRASAADPRATFTSQRAAQQAASSASA